jgi:ribonucleoside-diphosphate reductase alpha chain
MKLNEGVRGLDQQENKIDDYQKYIHLSRYARWLDKEKRRENWDETVDRYIDFFKDRCVDLQIVDTIWNELKKGIVETNLMPSMRCAMTAGKALDRDNVAGYNCAALVVDHPRVFDEGMYILLCGTGLGYSVERQFINKLPEVSEEFHETDTTITVSDSKIGWASALRELISLLYAGKIPKYDVSRVRPAGSRLKTFGGRASGPEPLVRLFKQVIRTFVGSKGRRLNSIECHDLMCWIADTVVVGGVRRSACISLSNLTDSRMSRAKTGQWWIDNPQRSLANISVAYTEKPDLESFMKELRNLFKSRSGERGFVNRVAFTKKCEYLGRDVSFHFIVNPCGEIILRPNQFCNLSEVIVRTTDTLEDLKKKVECATILGTLQSTLTNFRYLRKVWKNNTEEERLLGVSFTGIMDHEVMSGSIVIGHPHYPLVIDWLEKLREVAYETNKKWADMLGISPAKAITCIKPSGTVSQLVDSSSGIHPRFSPYYLRTVMNDKKDPIGKFLVDQGMSYNEDDNHYYFQFPIKAPENSTCIADLGAMDQLELWKIYADAWCDHNPSQTIYYTDDEFLKIGAWMWENFDNIGGLSFFPHSDNIYENAPYQEITEDEYNQLTYDFPTINWDKLGDYEQEDMTTASQEFACQGGACEL